MEQVQKSINNGHLSLFSIENTPNDYTDMCLCSVPNVGPTYQVKPCFSPIHPVDGDCNVHQNVETTQCMAKVQIYSP